MTETDICNMALSEFGKGSIASMEEGVENARACKLFYEPTRREILREFPWGFAHRIERLAVVDRDVPGWAYAYAYPDKCLKVNKIAAQVPHDGHYEPFDIINIGTGTKVVATDLENAYADFIWDVQDPALFDDVFVQAFAHLLASKMAMRLTGNPQVSQQEYQLYKLGIQSAQMRDAREAHTEPQFFSNYIRARQGRYSHE